MLETRPMVREIGLAFVSSIRVGASGGDWRVKGCEEMGRWRNGTVKRR